MSTARYLLLSGDDAIGLDRARAVFVEALLSEWPDLSEEHFDSTSESFDQYTSHMMTPSLFSQMRLFSVRQAGKLDEKELAGLATVLKANPPDIAVIIESEISESGRKAKKDASALLKFPALAKSNPETFVLKKLDKPKREYEIPKWLCTVVKELFKRSISEDTAKVLINLTGTDDLSRVYAELTKLDIFLPPGSPIDKTAIESIIGATRQINPSELATAVGLRDVPRAVSVIRGLFAEEGAAPLYIATLFRHFMKLLKIRGAVETDGSCAKRYFSAAYKSKTEAAHEIFVKAGLLDAESDPNKAYPMVLGKMIEQAQHFKMRHLRTIFALLADYDAMIKTGRIPSDAANFELLCYKIMRCAELDPIARKI